MQIESLRYFIELARTGSFYSAAKGTYISQQGLNKSISTIEAELDLQLVERSRRGVRLTSDGEVFLKHAKRIVAEYDLMMDELLGERFDGPGGGDPIALFASFYGAQAACSSATYMEMLAENTSYIEEPFDKLVERAANSDGTDLVFLDLHADSAERIAANPDVVFDPVVRTRFGFVWKQGVMPSEEPLRHRDTASRLPVAMCAQREIARFTDWLFRDAPLADVRMGATSPRMVLEYVQSSDEIVVATFDSFGFYLAERDRNTRTDGLRFTALSTSEASCQAGFLLPRHAKLSPRARHTIAVFKRLITERCGDYCNRYPLSE